MQSELYPSPHFEGVEKRIEINFRYATIGADSEQHSKNIPVAGGLRCLTRAALDACMTAAECEIVSVKSNDTFDAYVLSESSLFVFANKVVLKTCGTTKLLSAVDPILELAKSIDTANGFQKLVPSSVRFTRSTYLFPEEQREHHVSFADECEFLESRFGHLKNSNSFVMGSNFDDDAQWHVYVAGDFISSSSEHEYGGMLSVECCMTELNREHSQNFFRQDSNERGFKPVPFVSSEKTTIDSGIQSIFETFTIDDYVFEPCGYSMNGLNEEFSQEYSTIHITPEDGFSYCSVEHSNVDLKTSSFQISEFVQKCASVFKPGKMTFALTFHNNHQSERLLLNAIERIELDCGQYSKPLTCFQRLPNSQGFIAYLTFSSLMKTSSSSLTTTTMMITTTNASAKAISSLKRSETPMCVLDGQSQLSRMSSEDNNYSAAVSSEGSTDTEQEYEFTS